MKHKYIFFFYIVFFVLSACGDSAKNEDTSISGEIVNPKTPFIVILRDHHVMDTLSLDAHNRFYYHFPDDMKSGLYTFLHNFDTYYESQMFYIEKGDSLRLRLNTRDFDKSIMYSGDGAPANNFLMTLFLDSKNNSKMLPNYYKIGPNDFVEKVDSIGKAHRNSLKELKEDHLISNDFEKLAEKAIDYGLYDLNERYYFLVNKYNQKLKDDLPSDFLDYRNKADFNDETLQTYYIYQYFLSDYLKNRAVDNCLDHYEKEDCSDLSSKNNLKSRFKLADSLFALKSLRSRFLTRIGGRLIVHSQTDSAVDSIISFLRETNYDPDELHQLEKLADVQKRQFIGNIKGLEVTDPQRQKIKVSELLTKPTVFFYWSLYYKYHHLNQHKRMDKLQKRYPELNFIGINIDTKKTKMWKSSLTNFGYSDFSEYQLVCQPGEQDFYRNYLNKLIFVNKSGEILDNTLSLRDSKLEEKILGLINR